MKRQPRFLVQQAAEGTAVLRRLIREEVLAEANILAEKLPTDPTLRQAYIRDLVGQVFHNTLDLEVLKEFIRLTGTHDLVEAVAPRAKQVSGK